MFLKYLGVKKNYKNGEYDFSKGPCEIPDEVAEVLVQESPRTFGIVEEEKSLTKLEPSKGATGASKATLKVT